MAADSFIVLGCKFVYSTILHVRFVSCRPLELENLVSKVHLCQKVEIFEGKCDLGGRSFAGLMQRSSSTMQVRVEVEHYFRREVRVVPLCRCVNSTSKISFSACTKYLRYCERLG
jgi:hypothetical protein